MDSKPRKLVVYHTKNGKTPFDDWLNSLRSDQTKAIIDLRVKRLTLGLFGDTKSVGGGVHELRIDHGPGYRVYYALDGNTIVVLLLGGSKSTQSRDIQKAKLYFNDYRNNDDA